MKDVIQVFVSNGKKICQSITVWACMEAVDEWSVFVRGEPVDRGSSSSETLTFQVNAEWRKIRKERRKERERRGEGETKRERRRGMEEK